MNALKKKGNGKKGEEKEKKPSQKELDGLKGRGETTPITTLPIEVEVKGEIVSEEPNPATGEKDRIPFSIKTTLKDPMTEDVEEDEEPSGEIVISWPRNEMQTALIDSGEVKEIGGIGVKYNGLDAGGKGVYGILVNNVPVGQAHVSDNESETIIDVAEHGFSVKLSPKKTNKESSVVTVEIEKMD